MRNTIKRVLRGTAILSMLTMVSQLMAGPGEITVGIVPQQSATVLATHWIPLLSEVSARTGLRLVFRTAPDIPGFEERMQRGEYDLAYMNPYHYAVFSKAPGYQAFAKEKERKLVGIIVVAKDSPVKKVSELAGKTIAFPAPAAFAASILPRSEFSRLGIPIEAKYVSSHDSVYRGVAQGAFAAGGGIRRTLDALAPDVAGRLRILASTPSYVPHAFAAHPRVSADTVARIATAMTALGDDEPGRKLLEPLSFKGIEGASDHEWDEIRRLKINQPIGKQP